MRIVFGTDMENDVTDEVIAELKRQGHSVERVAGGAQWPEVGRAVGEAVASFRAERGVVCCWTGTGVSIAANKVPGVRAALCTDAATAAGARRWNDANVLAIGLRLSSSEVAKEMIDAFLSNRPDDDELDVVARVEQPPGTPSR
ncbi:MAG TPA: RpiB/LacA/LacB family sugar-phosphate isomerase [Acidimicrobiales bacterium]|nr:RpiB/LacA/LacB family sugar-phosphate isomerase [Acidimicrobiales bacterium]